MGLQQKIWGWTFVMMKKHTTSQALGSPTAGGKWHIICPLLKHFEMDVNEVLTTSYCQEKEMRIPARAPICCQQQIKVFSQANDLAEKCSSSRFALCAVEFELSIGSCDDYKTLSLKTYFDLWPPNCINLLLFWEELSQFLETVNFLWGCFSTCVLVEA